MVARKRRVALEDGWDFPVALREFDPARSGTPRKWLAARRALIPRVGSPEITTRRWLAVIQEHYALKREIHAHER